MKSIIATLIVLCASIAVGQSEAPVLMTDTISLAGGQAATVSVSEWSPEVLDLNQAVESRQARQLIRSRRLVDADFSNSNSDLVLYADADLDVFMESRDFGIVPSITVKIPGFFQTGGTVHQTTLSWNAGVCPSGQTCGAATGYDIYRSTTSGGPYTQIGQTTVPTTTYVDNSAAFQLEGTTYFYVSDAFNATGKSAKSNEVSTMVPISAPGVPPTMLPPVTK